MVKNLRLQGCLNPSLAAVRRAHLEMKVQLRALFLSEQIAALRDGETDLAVLARKDRSLREDSIQNSWRLYRHLP
jgi:hypothetical protein